MFLSALMVCFAMALLLPSLAFGTQIVQLSNGSSQYSVAPGQVISDKLVVSSVGTDKIPRLLIYAADISYDAKGNPSYIVPNRDSNNLLTSPASWLQVYLPDSVKTFRNTPYIILPVKGSSDVSYTVTVPKNVPPGDYAIALFFEMDNTGSQGAGSSAVNARAGMRINIRVTGEVFQRVSMNYSTAASSVASNSAVSSVPGIIFNNNLMFTLNFQNDGNIDTKVRTSVQLKQGDTVVADIPVGSYKDFILHPGDKNISYSAGYTVNKFLLGQYNLVTTYGYYDESLQRYIDSQVTASVWVIPWWILLIIGIIILGAVGFLMGRARRGKKKISPQPPTTVQAMDSTRPTAMDIPRASKPAYPPYTLSSTSKEVRDDLSDLE
jgi:hypothetical protein